MTTSEYHLVLKQAQKLSPQEQIQLIQQLADQMAELETKQQQSPYLIYGEFRNRPGREFSTEEDFKLGEWHPTK